MTNNVDPAEVAKFGARAGQWWDPAGPLRTLHDINPLRIDWVDSRAKLNGRRVIDVGCGGGLLAEAMAARGARVLGIDLAADALQVAEEHAFNHGVRVDYRHESAEACAARLPASSDIVTCMELLEHVPDAGSTVAACAALVKPGGWVFFSTINRSPKAFALAIVGAEYLLNLVPRGTHEYAKLIRPSELARHARQAGLLVDEVAGMHYNPLTRAATLSTETAVNYLMACRRPA